MKYGWFFSCISLVGVSERVLAAPTINYLPESGSLALVGLGLVALVGGRIANKF